MKVDVLKSYFPQLDEAQMEQMEALTALYAEWNTKVNLISRKDMEHFVERHLLHSLSLSFYWQPAPGHRVIDIGTGGGFPGIPLAVMYPDTSFVLVDSIGKKIKAVQGVADDLGLKNVQAIHGRAEEQKGHYQAAVSRAVARLQKLVGYCTQGKLRADAMYCLKGGDLREEVEEIDAFPSRVFPLSAKLDQPFFETKKVVYVKLR